MMVPGDTTETKGGLALTFIFGFVPSRFALRAGALAALGLVALGGGGTPAEAQRQPGALGLGFQVGRPGGLAVKWYRPAPIAYDAVLKTDVHKVAVVHLHRLWEQPLPDSPLHFYLGPGLVGGADRLGHRLGLSTEAGLNFYAERFEVFLHLTPTLRFLPTNRVTLDGNVGLRYYLRAP
jgi:hypothetical protein